MNTSDEHYLQLLSRHYSWMFGSFTERLSEQQSFFVEALRAAEISPVGFAIDLGSGPGYQAIALAQLGFSPVLAIDTSGELLEELQNRAATLPVRIKKADLRSLRELASPQTASIVVCMGDTLTHLASKSDITQLFQEVHRVLAPGCPFVITYRDLTAELFGVERFLPIRSDENTIMTCFVEYLDPKYVVVHDLVYTRDESGWKLNKSAYRKLRLGLEWVADELIRVGFQVKSKGPAGRLVQVMAKKP